MVQSKGYYLARIREYLQPVLVEREPDARPDSEQTPLRKDELAAVLVALGGDPNGKSIRELRAAVLDSVGGRPNGPQHEVPLRKRELIAVYDALRGDTHE